MHDPLPGQAHAFMIKTVARFHLRRHELDFGKPPAEGRVPPKVDNKAFSALQAVGDPG